MIIVICPMVMNYPQRRLGKPENVTIRIRTEVLSFSGNGTGTSKFRNQNPVSNPFLVSLLILIRYTVNPGPQDYIVSDFYHQSIVGILREALSHPVQGLHFHYEPYELYWKRSNESNPIRVFGELYTSPVFLDAHKALQDSPPEPGCHLPRVVAGLMLSLDSTHLTSFGDTKIWPQYLFFGNYSKYRRCKPNCHLCHHVAYFQKLPDKFKDFASSITEGKNLDSNFITHCNRELLHAQLQIILDDKFLSAYQHGVVIACVDGLERRFFPRLFTYSADYPEK
ncbi:hypothetical protein BDZ94DRAFT_1224430, partial [Collybia nuda]